MRIIYIVQHFSGPAGSSGSRPYENTRRLVQMGHEVVLLCGAYERSGKEDIAFAQQAGLQIIQAPVTYHQHLSTLKRLLSFREYMVWAIRQGKALPRPDLVFASSTPLTVGEVGRQIAAHHHVPFVFEVRDLWPEVPIAIGALRNPLLRWTARRMAQRIYADADHIIALSPGMKEGILAWGVPAEKVSVISNCCDTTLFGNLSPQQRAAERTRRGWEGKLVCTYAGSIGLVNGLDYLLDCAKILDQQGVADIHLAIVGTGSCRDRLAARIAKESISSISIHPAISKQDMPTLLGASDVGLVSFLPVPYMETNSANKFFDFLSAGLPVVINYGGWQRELLQELHAGYAVDPTNPATLADTLLRLRDDAAARAQMGRASRQLALRFDRDDLVRQLEARLRGMVHGQETNAVRFGNNDIAM